MPHACYVPMRWHAVLLLCLSYRRAMPDLLTEGTVTVKAGDALTYPAVEEYGPFDAVHVGASAGHIPKVSAQSSRG